MEYKTIPVTIEAKQKLKNAMLKECNMNDSYSTYLIRVLTEREQQLQ